MCLRKCSFEVLFSHKGMNQFFISIANLSNLCFWLDNSSEEGKKNLKDMHTAVGLS